MKRFMILPYLMIILFCLTGCKKEDDGPSGPSGPVLTWMHSYGGDFSDIGLDIVEIPTGGYYLVGTTETEEMGFRKYLLIRLDENGDELWERIIIGEDEAEGCVIGVNSDNEVLLALISETMLNCYDDEGNLLWTVSHDSELENITGMHILTDGSILISGSTRNFGFEIPALLMCNAIGNEIWCNSYSIDGLWFGFGVQPSGLAGFLLYGSILSDPGPTDPAVWRPFLLSTTGNGDEMWQQSYPFENTTGDDDYAYAVGVVHHTNDSIYLQCLRYVGTSHTPSSCLLRVNNYGVEQSRTQIQVSGRDECVRVIESEDGNVIVTGVGQSNADGTSKFMIISYDPGMNLLWSSLHGNAGKDDLLCNAIVTSDGGYILVGFEDSLGAQLEDILVVKTDQNGNL